MSRTTSASSKSIWAGKAMLRAEGLELHYGASRALRGVAIEARPGRVTCLLGRNGVGKTSLLRALTGLTAISAGRIVWDGQDIARLAPEARARRGVGYVPQGRDIFPLLTVEENLQIGFAPLTRRDRSIPDDIFALFPVLRDMLRQRGGDLPEAEVRCHLTA